MAEHLILSGAPEGYDAALLAREAARGAPVIHIARDDRRMAAMRASLAFLAPDLVVLDFPAWDTTPYDRVSPSPDIQAARMATLASMSIFTFCTSSFMAGVGGAFISIATVLRTQAN